MADSKKYNGSTWEHSLRKLATSTDTITTLPADLYADGNNATVGLVGNMSQTGTPSPTTPIQPQETGERTGNLFDYKIVYSSYINANGDISTTANNLNSWNYFTEDDIGKTFTVSLYVGSISSSYIRIQGQIDSNYITGNAISVGSTGYTEITVTPTSTSDRWRITYGTGTPDVVLNQVMVAVSATRKNYEPYGYKIPISSANTTTPVYLGEVQTTRKIKKLVLTGEEGFTKNDADSTHYLYYGGRGVLLPNSIEKTPLLCNELPVTSGAPQTQVGISSNNNFSVVYLNFGGDIMNAQPSGNTAVGLREYLAAQYAAGTPVTIWYVLATETTDTLNEPIRKIGDYADTVSGITIPTITGADSFDVLTTLKPSEVSLSYTGWHDATVEEWDGTDWQ